MSQTSRIPQHYDFLNPDNGVRGKMERLGKTPKNHMKEYQKEIREIESRVREEKEEESREPRELYKLSQFREVSSRVFDTNKENDSDRPAQAEFLSRGQSEKRREELTAQKRLARAEVEAKMEEARYFANSSGSSTPRKGSVPRADEVARLAPRVEKDFIRKNKTESFDEELVRGGGSGTGGGSGSGRRRDSDGDKDRDRDEPSRHSEFGRVPAYLRARKARKEEEEEERRRSAPDPDCPPGMQLMPEEERLNTLSVLRQSREEVLRQINALPFVIETPSQKRRQNDLEDKLREIDTALGLFSKPRVYIKADNY